MSKTDRKTIETLAYRRACFTKKLEQLETALSGWDRPIAPWTTTVKGAYSERGTRALAHALAGKAALCRKAAGCRTPGAAETAFYESFFYCALRVSGSNCGWLPHTDGRFGDVMALAKGLAYDTPEELILAEYRWQMNEIPAEFFYVCDCLYQDAAGDILKTIPKKVMAAVRAKYPRDMEEVDDFLDSADEFSEAAGFLDDPAPSEDPSEDLRVDLPRSEEFCEAYLTCRKSWFEAGLPRWRVEQDVAGALDLLLYGEGESPLLADSGFFAAYGSLDEVLRELRDLVREELP